MAEKSKTSHQRNPTSAKDKPTDPWIVRTASRKAERQWDEAKAEEPVLLAAELQRLKLRPTDRSANPDRTHQLEGPFRTATVNRGKLPQWQHEITSDGRVWYAIDKANRTIYVTRVTLTHPEET